MTINSQCIQKKSKAILLLLLSVGLTYSAEINKHDDFFSENEEGIKDHSDTIIDLQKEFNEAIEDIADTLPSKSNLRGISSTKPDTPMLTDKPERKLESKLVWGGTWGDWKGMSPPMWGYYACGAEMKFEDSVGGGDDTAANGVRLKFCRSNNWYSQVTETIYDGRWGKWKGMKMCPPNYYIFGAKVRFEDSIGGGDDTALNGLMIYCRRKSGYATSVMVYEGIWGEWKPAVWSYSKLVTQAEVRFENSQGRGDDTAMNGLKFIYETPYNWN